MAIFYGRPVPEIGLGSRPVEAGTTYSGILRRNDMEGYGCVASANGTRYYGQTRWGSGRGYGVIHRPDGGVYAGKIDLSDRHLGATISPKRDWVYYGEHDGIVPDGYGRRVGLMNGIESVSAVWRAGEVAVDYFTMADLERRNAAKMNTPVLEALRVKYERQALQAQIAIDANDALVLDHLRSLM